MNDDRTDRIAREAARLLETGGAADVASAIRAAAEALRLAGATLPGPGLVRRHAQGMAMQALGEEGYRQRVQDVWRIAEGVMTIVERAQGEGEILLVGRAARGQIDGGVTIHLRAYTRAPMRELVEALVAQGYEEPAFETARTRAGRLDRIRFLEDGQEIVLTRRLPEMWPDRERDLFTGRPIEVTTAEELRGRIG